MNISKFRTRFSLISSGKDREEKQIHLICTIDGNEVFYYSGYRVFPKNFIKGKSEIGGSAIYIQEVKKNTFNKAGDPSSRINTRLKELEIASQSVFDRCFNGQPYEVFSKEEFKRLLRIELGEEIEEKPVEVIFFDVYEMYQKTAKLSDERLKHIKSDIKKLRGYEETLKNKLNERNLDPVKYKKYLLLTLSENSVVSILSRLRAFFNYAKKAKFFSASPFDSLSFSEDIGTEQYSEPICMTREELAQLYTATIPKHLELNRDAFCLQAALGCRVGDFMRLTYNNIQDDQLVYFPSKIDDYVKKVVVPLSNRAKEILAKYKGKDKKDRIMPFVNSVQYNEDLKDIFKIAKLNRVVIKYNRDKKKEEYFKLHELASSHLARRTFVDILCQAGEPIHVVASMSGHSENSKAFERYRRRPEQLQKNAVSRSMD